MKKLLFSADELLSENLFIVPLTGKPIFPEIFTPLLIESIDDIQTIDKAIANDSLIGLVLLKQEIESSEDSIKSSDFYKTGTVAKIVKKINLPDGGINIFISTIRRFKIKKFLSDSSPIIADVRYLEDQLGNKLSTKALERIVLKGMKEISESNPLFTDEMRLNMANISHPGKIADFLASILDLNKKEQQEILETSNIQDRLEKMIIHLKKEQEVQEIQNQISKRINDKIEKNQREYFLKEELEAIKKELGLSSGSRSMEGEKYAKMLKKLPFPVDVQEAVSLELEKFQLIDPSSAEYFISKNYLDTIFTLPWEDPKEKEISLIKAKKILDRDHYGLKDVKERILEHLAVRKLKKDHKGSIICLVGPPGVGKTSIGHSIANALEKKFFRFSVGGMRDEAEIKGHRRTYVGSMPGKIVQGLKIVKTKDPVFLIDEIDKMGISHQGDPASALLEALDPEQNLAFRDHYLDIPFDLSQILFIVTANSLDSIPRPLLDRMEVIELSGYITEEKIQIAQKYLIPKNLKKNGLTKKDLKFSKNLLTEIILRYARESGVRHFEQQIDKICRKCAKKIVMEEATPPYIIKPQDLVSFLGQPWFMDEDSKKANRAGMSIGLAWTSMGGDTLLIEAVAIPSQRGEFKLTGQMGDVMQESASIAYSYVKSIAEYIGISPTFFNSHLIHLHIPEGATPKDGPSAGITMATALLSLGKGKIIIPNLAMTGELSLTGSVLPIGGLKEKTIAAKRSGITSIIIPKQNVKDLDEIPDYVKEGIQFIPVSRMEEVIQNSFKESTER